MNTQAALKLAPVEKDAIPERKFVGERHDPFYEYLYTAVEKVRKLSECRRVLWADFSVQRSSLEMPVVYVKYEFSESSTCNKTETRYFPIEELQSV
ncbi:hypothetical protein P886_3612 [Alteromonadaceae bacterium 2753L.S.0a.02]|nr:hypothetical protein P886_3612 [Alteromonadaceae bacterium 2753L.S.0a.02]